MSDVAIVAVVFLVVNPKLLFSFLEILVVEFFKTVREVVPKALDVLAEYLHDKFVLELLTLLIVLVLGILMQTHLAGHMIPA